MAVDKKNKKWKFLVIFLVIVVVAFAAIYVMKHIQNVREKNAAAARPKSYQTVSSVVSKMITWRPAVQAVATLVAPQGVNVTTQEPGKVAKIQFRSGAKVKQGQLLLEIDDRVNVQQLNNYLATLKINQLTMQRYKRLYHSGAISEQNYDTATANYKESLANVKMEQATIAYKHIRAPFSGKIGIRQVSLGQYLKVGDTIANLQSMHRIYADFSLPEQYINEAKVGQQVMLTIQGKSYTGRLQAIGSSVDTKTRNFNVRSVFSNKSGQLKPGAYGQATLNLGQPHQVVTVPRTAVIYSLYGDTVYVPVPSKTKGLYRIKQQPVTFGDVVGMDIIIKKGLKAGTPVVNSGQLKTRNGAEVRLNNAILHKHKPANALKAE